MVLKFYNTLGRKKMVFSPIKDKKVGLYTCGPTVYNYAHIGNLRTYIFEDILKRVLLFNGYKVKHIMNITDVSHLSQDEGERGEDKMILALKRENKELTPKALFEIANFYTKAFNQDIKKLNILKPTKQIKATSCIKQIIKLIKKIEKNGYTYQTSLALYFNVKKFKNYTQLAGQELEEKIKAARKEIVVDPEKKHPADFALWFKLAGPHKNHILHWPSPWGEGFPGWHIECSAISLANLGVPFDIHCGGIDHIPVHHTNEIAQNEAAYGRKTVNFWMHGAFLCLDKEKMAKSKGNFLNLNELIKKGYHPLAYRYLTLTAHYRQPLNFSLESLNSAQNALFSLWQSLTTFPKPTRISNNYLKKFKEAVNDDLNMPKAISLTWELVKSEIPNSEKLATLLEFDKVLGLNFKKVWSNYRKIPKQIINLGKQREKLRQKKEFEKADKIRRKIKDLGYSVEDTSQGPIFKKIFKPTDLIKLKD